MAYGDMPFGMADIKLKAVGGTVTVDLPGAQTLKFKERVASGELKGDDVLLAVAAMPEAVEWEISAGGIGLAALAIMTGRTVTTGGTTPSGTSAMIAGTGFRRFPYFAIYGKALGVGTDDVHIKLFKAKVTDGLEGSLSNGEFWTSGIKGIAVDDATNGPWEIVQNETAASLPAS